MVSNVNTKYINALYPLYAVVHTLYLKMMITMTMQTFVRCTKSAHGLCECDFNGFVVLQKQPVIQ